MKYCNDCGSSVQLEIPNGDNRQRHVCTECGIIHYQNPRIIVGCLPTAGDDVLLCKRAIEPRLGYWTLPAGFLENGESCEAGAERETFEETLARVSAGKLLCSASIPHINQVYMIYHADLADNSFGPTSESTEVKLFNEATIPWDEMAFPVMTMALKNYFSDRKTGSLQTHQKSIAPRKPRPSSAA